MLWGFVFTSLSASAYPLEESSSVSSISLDRLGLNKANDLVKLLVRVDIFRSLAKENLNNTQLNFNQGFSSRTSNRSFSTRDIASGLRAIFVLFLQIVVTVLTVVTGIAKLVLNLILSR